jgi:hypothetical protein
MTVTPVPLVWIGSSCSLPYGFVDIVAQAKTGAYTPATVVGEAPTRLLDRRRRERSAGEMYLVRGIGWRRL